MKYLFFFLLLFAVLLIAGCVSENKNTVGSTNQTTIQTNIIEATITSEPQQTTIKPSMPVITAKPTANVSEIDPYRNPWDLCPDSKMNEQKCQKGIFTDQGYCDYWKKRVEITCSKSIAGFDAKQTLGKTVIQPQIIPPEKIYDNPFIISEISQSVVEKGDTITIKGTSWKNPINTIQVWIFGDKYAKFDNAAVNSDGLFTYSIKTSSINPGKYYVLIQSPGIDNQFDISYNRRTDEVRDVKRDRLVLIPITSASVRSFTLMDAKSPTGSEAFYDLKAVLDNSEIGDDLYSEVKFEIAGQATPLPITDNELNAIIQDSKNKLNMMKQSDKADTIISYQGGCEIIKSKELGYIIDATDGNTYFFKGDYGSISGSQITSYMNKNHEYIFLHSHPHNVEKCDNGSYITTIWNLNTFSISDLSYTGELTNQGYHILKIYAISDYDYEIFPKKEFDWKSGEVIELAIQKIEKDLEVPFNNDVDNLMPILAQRLNYRYIVNNQVVI